ncbi:MAG: hypothetical protein K6F32_02905 [Bacilli bacterium]|nr:hypothetical protein [Bacilli bacterium]
MFKSKMSRIYILIEAVLFVALVAIQIATVAKGLYLTDKTSGLWNYMGAIKVTLTSVSLLFVLITFIGNRRKKKSFLDTLLIYFVLTVTADVFFSFSSAPWPAHLCFALTYYLFIFIRRGKWFEPFIPLAIGAAAFFVLHFALKMEFVLALLDSLLGAALAYNCACCYINYVKTKDRFYLRFAIAITFIFFGDLSIVLTSKVRNPMALNNAFTLANWPLYVSGNIGIVTHYMMLKEASD